MEEVNELAKEIEKEKEEDDLEGSPERDLRPGYL